MPHLLRPLGLVVISVMTLAAAACSQAPSQDAPKAGDTIQVIPPQAESQTPLVTPAVTESTPALIRALAAAPEGLSLLSPEGARVFQSVYGPDDCAWLGPDTEGPELPFDRYCVWPRDPNSAGRLEVLTGIVENKIVSVALIGHAEALPGWNCSRAPTAQNTELCVATGTLTDQKTQWNTAWNNFITVFINRP